MTEKWQALAREAELAAEHMAIGASALGNTNYAEKAYYYQAFFALSVGFERSAKLAILVDHAIEHRGDFPDQRSIRNYGHKLTTLLERVDEIAVRRGLKKTEARLPRTKIHEAIIAVLNDFATNITRYYNLELVAGTKASQETLDPIHAWFDDVVTPILEKHLSKKRAEQLAQQAGVVDNVLSEIALVRHTSETGQPLIEIFDASLQTALNEFSRPYARLYVMQIARFVSNVLNHLGYLAMNARLEDIPYFSDSFRIFCNPDRYFKDRKTWSIYRL